MSEPRNRARQIETAAPGILHWTVLDDRIHFRSDAHAVKRAGRSVLVDPLPLTSGCLGKLGKVEAICLTGSCHQRSAWRYRKQFGVKVYAPKGALGLEEKPDVWYRGGERLPGGLVAVHAPGPTRVHYALHHERGRGALFCADILMNDGKAVRFVSDEYQDEPRRTRKTAREFLGLRFRVICFDHGAPITRNARDAVRRALHLDRP